MKVERKPNDAFVPIVITIETKEEADVLASYLACNYDESLESYCGKRNVKIPDKILYDIYNKLTNIHKTRYGD